MTKCSSPTVQFGLTPCGNEKYDVIRRCFDTFCRPTVWCHWNPPELNMKKLKTASLFSGCGGLDLGFHEEGFLNVGAFDINPAVVQTFRKNISAAAHVADLVEDPIHVPRNIDVLLAGSPCQGFSLAGKRKLHDPRNNLLVRAGEYALAIRPKIFIAENVPGALVGDLKRYWDQLNRMLVENGYQTQTLRIDAAELGAAQTRRRAFLIAWSMKRDFNLDTTVSGSPRTLRCALSAIPNDDEHAQRAVLEDDSADLKIATNIKPGQKLSNVRKGPNAVHTWHIPEVFGKTTKAERAFLNELIGLRRRLRVRDTGDADPIAVDALIEHLGDSVPTIVDRLAAKGYLRWVSGSIDLANTFNGKYRRLMWERPSHTVDTYFGNPRYFLHPSEHRGFSVREAARIQGFPDSFGFCGTMKENFKMIGNAVSPIVSRHLAKIVREVLR